MRGQVLLAALATALRKPKALESSLSTILDVGLGVPAAAKPDDVKTILLIIKFVTIGGSCVSDTHTDIPARCVYENVIDCQID